MSLLRVEKLRKTFDNLVVLDSISFEVPDKTVTALIGASGSGKSTLLRAINLLELVDDGQIFFDGQDITAVETDADIVRRKLGMVFQSFNLFPHKTVLENITLAPMMVHGINKEQAESEARDLLKKFGLLEKVDQYPDRLSGGQQQRVAIIRAMAVKPKLLLLDEITSALDPVLVNEVLETVRELKNDGVAIVMATHEMGFAKQIADQVCFLYQGRILERGDASMLTSPKAAETKEFLLRVQQAGRL
ncbi:MAG: amino acid ABC transporter ATP-binding protein [Candidatus Nanopelagicaceae bacterium]|jgi:polar amino acid transport system ATP-binding protein|nr:amino acid ABC transporter ATP-binding protein [Candidatus Nanopelagicaceae bacterium]